MEKNFIRVRSVKDIVIFISLIILGVVFAIVPAVDSVNICGGILIIIGVLLAITLKTAYRNIETNEIYHRKSFSFRGDMKDSIISALNSNPNSIDLSVEGKGQALVLRLYYNKALGKSYIKFFEYIPYEYKPCSDMYEFTIDKVEKLL